MLKMRNSLVVLRNFSAEPLKIVVLPDKEMHRNKYNAVSSILSRISGFTKYREHTILYDEKVCEKFGSSSKTHSPSFRSSSVFVWRYPALPEGSDFQKAFLGGRRFFVEERRFFIMNTLFTIPRPENEPVFSYAPGTPERSRIKEALRSLREKPLEIPLIIGGKEVTTGNLGEIRLPHEHQTVVATYHKAGAQEVRAAVASCGEAWQTWSLLPWEERGAVFMKAAELLAGERRARVNAATMLGQSKTIHQSEIDAVCELVDFLKFNVHFMQQIYATQPDQSRGVWNRMDYRPLEGFVFAVSPFNFTSIGGNLASAPALMGNTVLWKPASTGVLSAYEIMRIFLEAGLPPGVVNFVPGDSRIMGEAVLSSPELGAVNFTGSDATFRQIWKTVASHMEEYRNYPRVVGETGGKDFAVIHGSADVAATATALIRGAFEYQGQKCSATSRAYVAASLWEPLLEEMQRQLRRVSLGDVENFSHFMGALIDEKAFRRVRSFLKAAEESSAVDLLWGGKAEDITGYFVEPTIFRTRDPRFLLMEEEIFGPVLTVYVYEDHRYEEVLHLCNETSPYGLTGGIFALDRCALERGTEILRYAAGNFYINDKTTGAVVGQQPFGGGRASGTNDKAGSMHNLLRWTSIRTIKENFVPPRDFAYPYMEEERQ